ncbi:hypothetical protein [Sphaerisporangium rufum]|nr:hypothetical protein [Sphaerisporangium rufum]
MAEGKAGRPGRRLIAFAARYMGADHAPVAVAQELQQVYDVMVLPPQG